MRAWLPALALTAMLPLGGAALGCGADASDGEDIDPDVAAAESATGVVTVYTASRSGCSTNAVRGLSEQLVAELSCIKPDALEKIETSDLLSMEPEVLPYLQPAAARALRAAVTKYNKPVLINSALRTIPQQYMLRRWDLAGRCGIRVAAKVGESNHESGLSLDVDLGGGATVTRAIRAKLQEAGFTWLGSGDPMHYDFKGEGSAIEGSSVLAFKRLWNRNNPNDQLVLNETYDAKAEAKLKVSPAEGFAIGARCEEP
jgi:hypothetical protein